MLLRLGGVVVEEAPARLLESASAAVWLVNAELIRVVAAATVIGDMVFFSYVYHGENVGNSARVEPDWPIIPWHICHVVRSRRSCLCCQLHVPFNLSNVLDESRV